MKNDPLIAGPGGAVGDAGVLREAAGQLERVDLNHARFARAIAAWLEEEATRGVSPKAVEFAQAVLVVSGPPPVWEEMPDVDKAAALHYMWKRCWEGSDTRPCRYRGHPVLVGLSAVAASRHAIDVCGTIGDVTYRLGDVEVTRLMGLLDNPVGDPSAPDSGIVNQTGDTDRHDK